MSDPDSARPLAAAESTVSRQLALARTAAHRMRTSPSATRAGAVRGMADALEHAIPAIQEANRLDFEVSEQAAVDPGLLDRLHLDRRGLEALVSALRNLARQPDPVGVVEESRRLSSGLEVTRRRVPLGVVAVLYESRPHRAAEAAALAVHAGNAVVLPLPKEAPHTGQALAAALSEAGLAAGLPMGFLVTLSMDDPATLSLLLSARDSVDLLVCRGAPEFTRRMMEASAIPVIWHGEGICHVAVDASADLEQAAAVVLDAKLGRPASTNSLKSLLLERSIAEPLLRLVGPGLSEGGVSLRADGEAGPLLEAAELPYAELRPEEEGSFLGERVLSVHVFEDLDEALAHIHRHGTGHSEALCTRDLAAARRFQAEVDAACVYVNASTRLTDGWELGMGPDLVVSTAKLPVRGPVTSRALTTTQYIMTGSGQVRAGDA